jgi:hypothetical protein
LWFKANPALHAGRGQGLAYFEEQYRRLTLRSFCREHLGVWDPPPPPEGFTVISPVAWEKCRDSTSRPVDPLVFAVDVSEDRSWASIAVAGGDHVEITGDDEVFDYRRGTDWIVPRVKRLTEKWGGKVAVAVGSPAWSLEQDLKDAKVELEEVSTAQLAQACGDLFDDIETGRLRHIGQRALDVAVAGAAKSTFSRDSWVWSRAKSSVDISPLVAVTLAHWMAQKRQRRPGIL